METVISTKTSTVGSFSNLCETYNVDMQEMIDYFSKVLNTSIHVENGAMVLKGRYGRLQLESIFRSFLRGRM